MRALYLSHTGMSEPLGRSQVLPYVRGLARAGWRIDIVSFEPPGREQRELSSLRDELAGDGIGWVWSTRSPAHDLGVKLAESARAFSLLAQRVLRGRPRIVHARSYLPAMVAHALTELVPGARFLFDCRGLLGDEYVDAGHWSRDSRRYRLVKRLERHLFARAHGVVTLTARLHRWLTHEATLLDESTPAEVIPCCVDLERFQFDAAARERVRAQLGAGDRFVLAYSGTLGSWYREREMADLFAALRRRRPALFAVFTRSSVDRLRAALRAAGVLDEDVVVCAAASHEMPANLSAADAAVSFIAPSFSKMASSPTKVAEYLAIGLPTVLNRGVGDVDELIADASGSGAVVDAGDLSAAEIEGAAEALAVHRSDAAGRARARAIAERDFSLEYVGIPRYLRLYERLAG